MQKEKRDELRERLLSDDRVRQAIAIRAYEIYRSRGGAPGREAEDWFQAEEEVIAYLIEEETDRKGEPEAPIETPALTTEGISKAPASFEPLTTPETAERINEPAGQTAEERTGARGELGVWSAAEPDSAQLAPNISHVSQRESETPARKRPKATTASTPRKGRSTAEKAGEAKAARAKKPSTKRDSSKKSAEEVPNHKNTSEPAAE